MDRRQFLRSALGTTAALGLATARGSLARTGPRPGITPRVEASRPPRLATDAYRTVVDAADAGADPTGEEPVDDVLDGLLGNDTLVWFPEGTYALRGLRVEGLRNLGLASRPGARATLRPAVPATAMDHRFLEFDGVDEFALQGFDLDYRGAGRGGAVRVLDAGGFRVRHCRVLGTMPDRDHPETPAAFRFDVADPGATGVVEGLVARDGGHDGGNAIGIYVGRRHAGRLHVRDCEIAGFPNNGLYASSPGHDEPGFRGRDGPVHVGGGVYRNNNVANVRLGSTGSTARGVRIEVDREPPAIAGTVNARGLRLRGRHGQVVEDCEIVLGPDAGYGFGGLVIHPDSGRATVRDTEIRVDADGLHAIHVLPEGDVDGPVGSTFEGVSVTGAAAGGAAVRVRNRRGLAVRDCSIRQVGAERDGLVFEDCRDCAVVDTTVDVTGVPIRRTNSTVRTAGVTTSGTGGAGSAGSAGGS